MIADGRWLEMTRKFQFDRKKRTIDLGRISAIVAEKERLRLTYFSDRRIILGLGMDGLANLPDFDPANAIFRQGSFTLMRWGPILLCCWPGLPGLWFRGQWASVVVAFGFSILLNLALVSSFLWRDSLGETFPLVAWPVIFSVWTFSAFVAYRRLPDLMAVPTSKKVATELHPDTLFIQAQGEYLKGHWEEAKGLLVRQIQRNPRDVESRLLLATLFRHTKELESAKIELAEMQKFDESIEWKFEVDRERELLTAVEQHELAEAPGLAESEDLLPTNNDGIIDTVENLTSD